MRESVAAVALVCAVILTGCTQAPPPAEAVPTPSAPSSATTDAADPAAPHEPPETLPGGENEALRVRLADHAVRGESVRVVLDVLNKRDDARLQFGYAFLNTTAGEVYFDLAGIVPATEERRLDNTTVDSGRFAQAPWRAIELYFEVDDGGEWTQGGALTLDVSGRGLPSNVS